MARAWRYYGVQPWRAEAFKFSTNPQLVAKVTDVVGLHLAPPENVFAEDHSRVRTGTGPVAMALRNFAVSRHRLAGATNIVAPAATPAATRYGPRTCSHIRQINYSDALAPSRLPSARAPNGC